MSTITIDGYKLAYTAARQSSAPPLIMLHGWLSHRGVWRQTMPALEGHYYCVAVDLLGFGDSDKPADGDYSITAQARRVLQLADAWGFDKFTLMGHSMGGQTALCIAAMLAPERVLKLVSVAGVVAARLTPQVEREGYPVVARGKDYPWLYTMSKWLCRVPWIARRQCRAWFYRMDAIPFAEWEIDRAMAFRPEIHISAYAAGQAIRGLDLTPHLPKITAPTLAIFGRQDGTVPVSDGHLVAQHVPDSRLVLIDECGHFPMYEQTEEYLAALRGFLVGDY